MGMQQFMSDFTAWLIQEFFIQFYNGRIFMGFANCFISIFCVKRICSLFQIFIMSMQIGLSATVDTATRTGHYFYDLVVCLAFSYFFSPRPGSKDAGALHFYVDSAVFPCYNGVK